MAKRRLFRFILLFAVALFAFFSFPLVSFAADSSVAIVTQPTDVTCTVGETAVFTVVATGDGLTYSWEYSDDNGVTWYFSAQYSSTYIVEATEARDGRLLRCTVTDSSGTSVTSRVARLTVVLSFGIVTQPQDVTCAVGSNALFTVVAAGDGLTYTWEYSDNDGSTWELSAQAGATLSIQATQGRSGRLYRCTVTDSSGNSVTSRAAKLTVLVDSDSYWLGNVSTSGSAWVLHSNETINSDGTRAIYAYSGTGSFALTFSGFEAGNVYNGQIRVPLNFTVSGYNASKVYCSAYIETVSSYEGISVGMTSVSNGVTLPHTFSPYIYVNFSNFHASSDSYLFFNFNLSLNLSTGLVDVRDDGELITVVVSSQSDYTGTVYCTSVTADSDSSIGQLYNIDNSIGQQTIIQQSIASDEMAQQESIAAAQAEQSAQQHQEVISGYDSSSADSVAASQSAQLDSYQSQQDAAFDDANSKITDFTSTSFTTAPIASMATSFAFVSTLFNLMWSGFGEFTVLFVVSLSLGVAGIILKLKKGG